MTISPEFTNYLKTPKAKIIHIKELRQKDDGRSSLWIRAEIP